MNEICGYLVVRKPEFAKTDSCRQSRRIGQKLYRGVDRLQWEDFAAAGYGGRLPASLRPIWRELKESNSDLSGIDLLKSYERTLAVLEFSGEGSEIVAIWSTELANIKGVVQSRARMKHLGLDCVAFGEWSVLLAGVYGKSECFERAAERLNEYGLLKSEEDCDAVFYEYVKLSSQGIVEPLANTAVAMKVKVYAVLPGL